MTPAEAMYLRAKEAGVVENIDSLQVLAIRRCNKENKRGRCQQAVAYLYATRVGPLLVALVPNDDHDLANIPTHQARRAFAESRDETLGARSEWDLVDAVLSEHDGWHPQVLTVVCRDHGPRPFNRDAFIAQGRHRRGRTVDIDG